MSTTILRDGETAGLSVWKGAMLVCGTCIGGGMLAMPIQTADSGFCIASLVLLASWIFMSYTGLLLVEATLWLRDQSHFSTIAQALLGAPGRILSLIVYLFMNTASLVAYTSGGALLFDYWITSLLGISLGYSMCCVLFTVLFGGLVSLGLAFISKVNSWFVLLMGVFYCYLVCLGLFHLRLDYLTFRPAWVQGLSCFPLIFAAFSHQMIVPSLCSYLNYNAAKLKKSILIGTAVPFAVYFLWLLIIHGIIPFEGADGLHAAFENNSLIVEPFKVHFSNPTVFVVMDAFAFLALVTSYLGLSIALFDFVRDMFKGLGKYPRKETIIAVSILPCLFLAMLFQKALLNFLDASGGFGDALLSGMIPVSMIWIGRYRRKYIGEYKVAGGKPALIGAGVFALAIFIIQWVKLFW
ncbi:MAG: aromatic amino acid transport family protein [Chlamydiales bacterium]